jgi:hypothetical protein
MAIRLRGNAGWPCAWCALVLGTAAAMVSPVVSAQEEPPPPPIIEADDSGIKWSFSGLMRLETAIHMTGQENIVNQRGNPFNGKPIARNSIPYGGDAAEGPPNVGSADIVVRNGEEGDNAFNLMQLRSQFDIDGAVTEHLRIFARVRGIYDFAPYDEYDPDSIGSQAVGNDYQEPEYFENRDFLHGGSTNPLEIAGRKFMIDMPALYVDYTSGPVLIRFGQQQIAWGQALFFRVLDLPNGLDLRRHLVLDYAPEEFADERIGSLGLRTTWQATQNWEVDAFVQRFLPTLYPNPNTPYNAIASQFTVRDQWNNEYNDKFNGGLRLRGNFGAWSAQFAVLRRYNPDGVYKWTKSKVARDLPAAPGSAALMAETAFEADPSGVQSAVEWFTYAGNARLDGLEGLNASITEFPAAGLLGALAVDNKDLAAAELDLFFQFSGGMRGHIAREYKRETNVGGGVGYVVSAAPGSLLDQLIINVEVMFTPDRNFTNTTLSREYIEDDEWIGALVMEKYQRFSQDFPATYLVFQWMHRTESDLFGRNLKGMGGTANKIAEGVDGGWNGLVFAMQQPSPSLTWRFDGAILYDTRGGILVQPALRWAPSTSFNVELFYNFINGNLHGDDNENIMQTLEYADELGIRAGFQF